MQLFTHCEQIVIQLLTTKQGKVYLLGKIATISVLVWHRWVLDLKGSERGLSPLWDICVFAQGSPMHGFEPINHKLLNH